jgi:hypothetical protein
MNTKMMKEKNGWKLAVSFFFHVCKCCMVMHSLARVECDADRKIDRQMDGYLNRGKHKKFGWIDE